MPKQSKAWPLTINWLGKYMKLTIFVAIDFETANFERSSVCSVGLVKCIDGKITDEVYCLIKPEPYYFSSRCTAVHGLTKRDVYREYNFKQVWRDINPFIGDLPLIAHNRAFDRSCLEAAFAAYDMGVPRYDFYCSLLSCRDHLGDVLPNCKLNTVCDHFGIQLDHHQALSDARACALITLKLPSVR